MTDADERDAAILRFVDHWRGVTQRHESASGHCAAPAVRLTDRDRVGVAAGRARVAFPGPIGELVAREVHAYLDFGHRFDGCGLVPRVVEHLLAAVPAETSSPG